MCRRAFIIALAAAAAWPRLARAQQMPVIGYLNGAPAAGWEVYVSAFLRGLAETGYAEGKNLRIEYRWADNQYDRLPGLAADLVQRDVAVIFSDGGTVTALTAQKATNTIPVVFMTGGDPVKAGLIPSLNRPGGNLTGVTIITDLVIIKRLELLRELLPRANSFGLLLNPGNPNAAERSADVRAAAAATAMSKRCSRRWRSSGSVGSSCRPIRSFSAGVIGSRNSRCGMLSRRSMKTAAMPRPAVSSAMAQIASNRAASPASIPVAFSKARSRPTCRCNSRPSSSS
ncbi:MAG: hypothetical protein E6G78_22990 [Alphaproteobacteria bacterium]|nr:MAG: hypothetical protein E6G78_22990 [Alphaproteobacteria bacterium]